MTRNRERILDAAARLLRAKGLDGMNVSELMHDAGMTHGGFYNHFQSRDELAGLAVAHAFEQILTQWKRIAENTPDRPFEALAQNYLSMSHFAHPERGCPVATVGPQTARAAGPVRISMSEGIQDLITLLETTMPGRTRKNRRKKAMAALAGMVGGLVLARCAGGEERSRELLTAAAEHLKATFGSP